MTTMRTCCAVALVLLAACGGREPDAGPPPEDTATPAPAPDFVQEGVWSPDGRRIVVSRFFRGRYRLYGIFPPDTSGPPPAPSPGRRLSDGPDSWASWSPDRLWIAFHSTRDGNGEIYRMRPDGSGPVNLTRNPADDSAPSYAPDGRRIAFTSDRDGAREVWVMNADGSGPRPLTDGPGEAHGPAWSPRGGRIAFYATTDDGDHVYLVDADGGTPLRLAPGVFPAWSPDGARVLYDRNDTVFWRPADGGDETVLVVGGFAARMAPDGRRLTFVRGRWPRSSLFLKDVVTGAEVQLTP